HQHEEAADDEKRLHRQVRGEIGRQRRERGLTREHVGMEKEHHRGEREPQQVEVVAMTHEERAAFVGGRGSGGRYCRGSRSTTGFATTLWQTSAVGRG